MEDDDEELIICVDCGEWMLSYEYDIHYIQCHRNSEASMRLYRNSQLPSGSQLGSFIREHFHVNSIRRTPSSSISSSPRPSLGSSWTSSFISSPSIPIKKTTPPILKNAHISEMDNKDCAICIEPLEEINKVKKLICAHMFCEICITKWINLGKRTCPLCKQTI